MTGKELLGHLSGMVLCIDIGAGDTVFWGAKVDDKYILQFNLLANPAEPGTDVGEETAKDAKPYFGIGFTNLESFNVFSKFVAKFYQLAKNKAEEADNG